MASQAKTLEQAQAAHRAGNLTGAERAYRTVLAADPWQFDALHGLCVLSARHGRYGAALVLIDRALNRRPGAIDALITRANVLQALGRNDEALASCELALRLDHRSVPAAFHRAVVLEQLGRAEEALAAYDAVLAMSPSHLAALGSSGLMLQQAGHPSEALSRFDRILALVPHDAGVWFARGVALQDLDRHAEAVASFDRALIIDPRNAEAHTNRGAALYRMGRYGEALSSHDRALRIAPEFAPALNNRGLALRALGRHEEALACYASAVRADPECATAHLSEAICRLALGDFGAGWSKYEWRWRAGELRERSGLPPRRWTGEHIDGTLLAWGEQGLGDEILYASMLDELSGCARHLVVEVEPRLVALFARSFPELAIVARQDDAPAPAADAHVPLGSIGTHFRRRWSEFPRRDTGYLRADALQVAELRGRLLAGARAVIGISWISKSRPDGPLKSAALTDLAPLLGMPGARFVDLQYGDTDAERTAAALQMGCAIEHVADVDNSNDLDRLAALVCACDAVVTVSNTTAHLAGALGRPVWILLPHLEGTRGGLWYWHVGRSDSPWYPRASLIRQPAPGDWRTPARHVRAALDRMLPA